MSLDFVITLVSLFGSILSIVFAYYAFRRSNRLDQKEEGKAEGVVISDIGYIKACVDRVEKNINKVDELYRSVVERLVKLEETVANITKLIDQKESR